VPETVLPDGRTVQYWLGGADAGPAVLFFHGCPDTRWAARTGAAAAQDLGVRLLCVNRQGYGRSAVAPSTHQSAVDDAFAVADELGIGEVAVLGMSVGGGYAAAAAVTHPERVTRLGVVATLAPPPHEPGESMTAAMARLAPDFADYVAGLDPADPDDFALVARFVAGLPQQDAELLTSALSTAELARSVREALARPDGYLRDAALTFRPWAFDVSSVRCPTWLWYGEEDQRAMPGGEWLVERIPGARLVVRPGATHWASLAAWWPEVLSTLALLRWP
jgi:pimeloyl-ACP methyl ester carboxylesterase